VFSITPLLLEVPNEKAEAGHPRFGVLLLF